MDREIAALGDTLRRRALDAIEQIRWVPERGKNRMTGMLMSRPDCGNLAPALGNVVAPQDLIATSGADNFRFWASASDYADDLRIGPQILRPGVETYRKLRNTIRWTLGNLPHFRQGRSVPQRRCRSLSG